MILFFDRDIGIRVPQALVRLRFDTKHHEVHWHQQHFSLDDPDDRWLPIVGQRGWTVIGHDQNHWINQSEIDAIRQYSIGSFSIWGASNTAWEKMQCFARAYDDIVDAEANTPRPFIIDINRRGQLKRIL